MNTDNKAHGTQEDNQYQKPDQNIEWDNADATYGHTISDSPFKRKTSLTKIIWLKLMMLKRM
jgi:hypothetical protein